TIVFTSAATNLVAGDTNNLTDVFVMDLASRAIERVNVGAGGVQSDAGSNLVTSNGISTNGRRVLFRSAATNLTTPQPPAGTNNFYIHDVDTGQNILVNAASDGTLGDDLAIAPTASTAPVPAGGAALTPDGNYLLFGSQASNLVSGDTN